MFSINTRNKIAIYLVITHIIGILSCAWLCFLLLFAVAMSLDIPGSELTHAMIAHANMQAIVGIGVLIILNILPMVFCWRLWNHSRYVALIILSLLYWIEFVVALYFYYISN